MIESKKINNKNIEDKWQKRWEEEGIYKSKDFIKRKKYYLLVEFPYPSGLGLHIGHAFTNTIGDIYARFKRMQGFNVMFPMGWDSFGLPTENSAIKLGIHPTILTKQNTEKFEEQNKILGFSFDWSREIDTSDPDYYRWTQWIFLQFFKNNLAYKKETQVGWCPSCKIILANEEIVAGKCERCGTEIEYRKQKQWLLRITEYADRLDKELDLVDYPDYVKKSQRDWIGCKEWTDITYPIEGTNENIIVSTTRPDTNYGATFVVVAPEHPIVASLLNLKLETNNLKLEEIREYVEKSKKKSELERISEGKKKTGIFTGLYAVNQLNGYKMPIWIADFVLMDVGTGAVVGVPGHDKRDFEFAKEFKLPIIRVIIGKDGDKSEISKIEQIQEEGGIMVNSGFLNGMEASEASKKIIKYFEDKDWGKRVIRYHLRDWIFSRQHYWGEPIPIINCPKCGMVPVPEDELPVRLPEVEKYQPTDTGESPLANLKEWVEVSCPSCKAKAKRETDTMPNWAGSSWYYLRYCDPQNNKKIADENKLTYWTPVDIYIGGAEHTTLHLLYSRFWHKFLNDLKLVPSKEPYSARRQHGVILGEDGYRMSKSRGNVIDPIEMVEKFGADSLRMYLMFMGPYDSTMAWNTSGIEGMSRFIGRLWNLFQKKNLRLSEEDEKILLTNLHKTIKKVTEDVETFNYNTAISSIMVLVNFLEEKIKIKGDIMSMLEKDAETKSGQGVWDEALEKLCQIIAPFTPHLAEEVWNSTLKLKFSIHQSNWPKFDPKLIVEDRITIIVQVNGKVRSTIKVKTVNSNIRAEIIKLAKGDEKVKKYLHGKVIKKEIFIPGKLLNLVV
ncbi:leucine--tRNA ligase [Candidatus Woesebacteria bacterium RBG_13_34_9]|uniref:Leucine--tRNA ligase n=1 Tax=Candidatus Woesebacteria bacterium RBG_13_34_9 TaxID=1802477 RepID=A0A1F7X6F8_9BACT|nr:MAG: leucine--tRNA ligase [Candidatus Woesebacteria bacterium RBG_13_34_9]